MIKKLLNSAKRHKITTLIILAAIGIGVYFVYSQLSQKVTNVSYELTKVKKGSIQTIVSGSGQVNDVNQINITPEVSGEITKIAVSLGQEVKAGDLIAQIDSSDLEDEIYQARLALDSAELDLEEMQEIDESAITKAENELTAAQNDLTLLKLTQEDELTAAKEDKKEAQEELDDLDKDDPDYDSGKETYTAQLKEAKRKIEEYNIKHPLEIAEAEAKIEEKEQALTEVKEGPNERELRQQENTVEEKQSKLDNLISQRDDYSITAPRDGTVALINYSEGEKFSAGSSVTDSTALIVLISKNKNAVIAINEVDVPYVAIGQKANLSFDALPDLAMTGTVSEIDLIGTVEQNVVYNNVTVSFDEQDDRIKNGMTVNVDIITQSKQDILLVPTTAIKSQADGDYVQVKLDKEEIKMVKVETGISNDTNTEIISGLDEGDIIVAKAINTSQVSSSNNTNKEREGSFMMFGR